MREFGGTPLNRIGRGFSRDHIGYLGARGVRPNRTTTHDAPGEFLTYVAITSVAVDLLSALNTSMRRPPCLKRPLHSLVVPS